MKITNGVQHNSIKLMKRHCVIVKLNDYFIIGISLVEEKDEQMDENMHLSSVCIKSTYSASHSINSQIDQFLSETNASLEELMAQMKSI